MKSMQKKIQTNCNTCKTKITNRYVMFDKVKYCLKCFYTSGKSLPIFHNKEHSK